MPSVMLTQIVRTGKKNKLGISFFRINRHLSPDPNILRLKWCRTVSDHSYYVTTFVCLPHILQYGIKNGLDFRENGQVELP